MEKGRVARLVALVIAMWMLASVAGCSSVTGTTGGGSGGGSTASTEVKLTEADNGKTVEVAKGGTVVVALKGNATTGYLWAVDGTLPSQLQPEGQPTYSADTTLIGSPGVATMRFKAVSAGEGDLKLKYWRSFEPTTPPVQTWSAKVVVK